MSVPNILQSLSELSIQADQIIGSSEMTLGVQEWIKIVKERAMEIVNSDSISPNLTSDKIPDLVGFLNIPCRRVSRVSAVFRQVKKDHLHPRKKGKQSLPLSRTKGTSESSRGSKSPFPPDLNDLNSTYVKSKICSENIQIKPENTNGIPQIESSIKKGFSENKTPFSTKKKRKSSNELSNQSKKSCSSVVHHSMQPSGKSLRSAMLEKVSATKKNSCISNQASMKSSVGLANSSILKENRALRKREEKNSENLKNTLANRKQKIEENKRKREEKMERTQQQRIKLEKEKMERKFKCREKLEKSVTGKKFSQLPQPKATPEIQKVALAHGENKGPREIKNATIIKLKTGACSHTKKIFASVEKNEKHSSSTRTPKKSIKRSKNDETELSFVPKVPAKKCLPDGLNLTVSKSKKGDETFLKTVNVISKCVINEMTASSIKQAKIAPKDTKTSVLHPPEAGSSTPVQRKAEKLESYEMTPARTSYVSYDISEIKSDSEDEQEQKDCKPIPGWATGVRLRNALLQQFHASIDTDKLFGNYYEAPNLHLMMGVQKKQYNRRTSSAIWNSSFT